jgi:hypothetical protein
VPGAVTGLSVARATHLALDAGYPLEMTRSIGSLAPDYGSCGPPQNLDVEKQGVVLDVEQVFLGV